MVADFDKISDNVQHICDSWMPTSANSAFLRDTVKLLFVKATFDFDGVEGLEEIVLTKKKANERWV